MCVPENIHTHTTEGHRKFRGGGGLKRPEFLKASISLNWNFLKGGRLKPKKPSGGGGGGVWIFSETTQCAFHTVVLWSSINSSNIEVRVFSKPPQVHFWSPYVSVEAMIQFLDGYV